MQISRKKIEIPKDPVDLNLLKCGELMAKLVLPQFLNAFLYHAQMVSGLSEFPVFYVL